MEIGSHAHKSNEGLYTVQGSNQTELTLEEVMRAARKLGFTLSPVDRQTAKQQGFQQHYTQPKSEQRRTTTKPKVQPEWK